MKPERRVDLETKRAAACVERIWLYVPFLVIVIREIFWGMNQLYIVLGLPVFGQAFPNLRPDS